MKFTTLLPKTTRFTGVYLGDKIRVGFPLIQKATNLVMYLGKDVCKKYGFSKEDKVALEVADEKEFLVRLVKNPQGFKFSEVGNNLRLQLRWEKKIPQGYGKTLVFATYTLFEGELEITLPKANEKGEREI